VKVSIITVVFNNVSTVEETIRSVISQDYPDVEYIVIDGKSTDGTLQILEGYQDHFDVFVSEKDEGLYDAINKGISLASGDIVGILHSDDLYYDRQVISRVVESFQESHADCVYGDLDYVKKDNTNEIVRDWKSGQLQEDSFQKGWMPPHPTFFTKRSCYLELGTYNTSFRTSADYELMLRFLCRHKKKAVYLEKKLVKMREGGVSNASLKNRLKANREDMKAWRSNNLSPKPYTRFMKPLRKILQFSLLSYAYRSAAFLCIIFPFLLSMSETEAGSSGVFVDDFRVLLSLFFAFGIAALTSPVISKIAKAKNLVDTPNRRSAHFVPVPTLGGVAVFASIALSLTLWGSLTPENGLQYVLASLTLIFFIGMKDDIMIIDPNKKLIAQVLSALILIIGADIRIESLYGIMGIGELNYYFSVVFSTFVFIVITNAYNLVDGIDGLASSLGIMAAGLFGTWFFVAGHHEMAILALSMVGAYLGFMKQNFSKTDKIFLGDTGSLLLGTLVAILAMQFIRYASMPLGEYYLDNAPLIAIGLLSVPLFDTLRVFSARLMEGHSPFLPDKRHIHHILLRRGIPHARATFIICVINALFVAIAWYISGTLAIWIPMTTTIVMYGVYALLCVKLLSIRPHFTRRLVLQYARGLYPLFWETHGKISSNLQRKDQQVNEISA
jgi:UDP-N-acetylmuramyl pentapeptide phosphotransferase/UDP-N-acetylglucosamine-1-phosphate transferase/glycosyltransferase involved in cell wall biosynthesis